MHLSDLRISIVQADLVWENKADNLSYFEKVIKELKGKTDLVVLPEMFTTGFSMNVNALSEDGGGEVVNWMHQLAEECELAVCGSIMYKDIDKHYNRFLLVNKEGEQWHYDKRHLFRLGGEHEAYKSGNDKLIVNLYGWKICPMVCYDLRFPVWSRNKCVEGDYDYDLLIYVANWPESRKYAWETLMSARAIENQCFVAAVNRVGVDGRELIYSGDSAVLNYRGLKMTDFKPNEVGVATVTLNYEKLQNYRNSFPFGMDGDDFKII